MCGAGGGTTKRPGTRPFGVVPTSRPPHRDSPSLPGCDRRLTTTAAGPPGRRRAFSNLLLPPPPACVPTRSGEPQQQGHSAEDPGAKPRDQVPGPITDPRTLGAMPSRTWAPPALYDLARTLRVLRRGRGDPACRQRADGTWWRPSRTPDGTGHPPDQRPPRRGRRTPDHRYGVGSGMMPTGPWNSFRPCSVPMTSPTRSAPSSGRRGRAP